MEPLLSTFPVSAWVGIFSFIILCVYNLLWKPRSAQKHDGKSRTAPEADGAWPIIGHLHLLADSTQLPHIKMSAMADKFGPIFTIKLGMHRTLVVSNLEMAKECLTTNDRIFANRPKLISVELIGYNYALFGLGPYSSHWRQMRKIAMVEVLSAQRVEKFGYIRQSEVKMSIKEMYEKWVENNKNGSEKLLVEMKRWFGDLSLNVILRMLAGKRYSGEEEEGVRFQNAMREFFEFAGMFLVSDLFPFLRFLDLGGYEKAMKKTAKEMDSILSSWLEEHKQKRNSGEVKGEKDFIDVMLSKPAEEFPSYDHDTVTKATCESILSGSTDTTSTALTWALSLLLNNRHALKKAQEEIDIQVGRDRQVEESDLKNLVYLDAIIKETLRLYPAATLNAPHEAMEDCTVGGYHIPKGTRLMVNIWKIHHDPHLWSDPDEFKPERFLTTHKNVDARGQHFELIPFSSGRRMCPGASLSLQVMPLTLASLLQGFELDTISNELVDMSESYGLTNLKTTPLEVLVTPRLSANLYG